jgi:hypothetical protein
MGVLINSYDTVKGLVVGLWSVSVSLRNMKTVVVFVLSSVV